jgi:hypothetical protein
VWLSIYFIVLPLRFQQLVRLPDTESKYQQLAYLAHDFQHAAEVYGRIIISERFVPVEFKTIKPLDIGAPPTRHRHHDTHDTPDTHQTHTRHTARTHARTHTLDLACK